MSSVQIQIWDNLQGEIWHGGAEDYLMFYVAESKT